MSQPKIDSRPPRPWPRARSARAANCTQAQCTTGSATAAGAAHCPSIRFYTGHLHRNEGNAMLPHPPARPQRRWCWPRARSTGRRRRPAGRRRPRGTARRTPGPGPQTRRRRRRGRRRGRPRAARRGRGAAPVKGWVVNCRVSLMSNAVSYWHCHQGGWKRVGGCTCSHLAVGLPLTSQPAPS